MRDNSLWCPEHVRWYCGLVYLPTLIMIFRIRNVAEQLIEKGLASVVRHRRDDEDRSADFDKLMAAEQA